MYSIDGEDFPLEMLTADHARDILHRLQAQAAASGAEHQSSALAAQIHEVSAWLEHLAAEEAAAFAEEAAIEHRAAIHADELAGVH
ncbi:hypothetical protein [Mycolicibacterium nivoides]|uniref:Uncharacterized protein n=1 Tax=Mycolicibacterium nivoides TaxID=2487344 RepID=A0ABW9LLS5_9MYCO